MALNEYAQIQDESLKCELQKCYFTEYNNGDYLNRKNSFRVQRALDKLWNMDELRYRGIVFNNEKLRDIIMNEMDPSVLNIAVSCAENSAGEGNYLLACAVFMFTFFSSALICDHMEKKISIGDLPDIFLNFLLDVEIVDKGKKIVPKKDLKYKIKNKNSQLYDNIFSFRSPKPISETRFTPIPNQVYQMDLSGGEILVYSYLMYIEDRKTYTSYAAYNTIGEVIGMSKNTVKKYARMLEKKGLIQSEPTTMTRKNGEVGNGCLRYRIRPIGEAVELYDNRQYRKLLEERARAETQRAIEEYDKKRA